MIARRAVVVGGSVAGMAAARVLADHFEEVVVCERDPLTSGRRKGAPQSEHVHVLLRRGVDLLEGLFPGIHEEMLGEQVRPFDFGRDLRWYQFGGWLPRATSGIVTYPQTRRSLEGHIRRRLRGVPNVRFQAGTSVRGLRATADGRRVTGIVTEGRDGGAEIPAALVVDAAGRGSAVYRWIEALGYPAVEESTLEIDLHYVSRFYTPPRRPRDWRCLWISPFPPQRPRAGALQLVEGDRWLLSLAGYHGDHPTADPDHYESFARTLADPAIAAAIAGATPISDPVSFRIPKTRWRRIERARRFPAGLVVLGDAYCMLDPVFGQGMTVALVSCDWLSRHLKKISRASALTPAWTAGFYRDCSTWMMGMWTFATGEAYRHPATPGERTRLVKASQWYVEQIYGLSHDDPAVYRQLLKLTHMLAGPEFLLRPDMALRIAARSTGFTSASRTP